MWMCCFLKDWRRGQRRKPQAGGCAGGARRGGVTICTPAGPPLAPFTLPGRDMTDYEAATAFLGEWGRFQREVFFLLCLSVVPNGFCGMSVVFVADTPAHACLIPARANLTAAWRNSSAPRRSRCSRYRLEDVRRFSDAGLLPGVDVDLANVSTEGCLDGWEYDRSVYVSTIVSEWDLVCENRWKKPLTSSLYFGGVLAGSLISGQLSDRYGRKIVLFVTMAVQTLFMLLQVFSPSWPVFCAMFFVVGLGQISIYMAAFVLGTEILGPRVRTVYSTAGVSVFFGVGYMLLPLFAYFLRDWRKLLLGLALPGFLCVPFWWYIPESPRWLLSQGRVEEAEDVVRAAAKRNGIEPPPVIFRPFQRELQCESRRTHNICDLLRSGNIRWVSLTLWLLWKLFRLAALHPDGKPHRSVGVAESPAARELRNAAARHHRSHAALPRMLWEGTVLARIQRGNEKRLPSSSEPGRKSRGIRARRSPLAVSLPNEACTISREDSFLLDLCVGI
ncbi:organic cation/carnitine transporter 2-like isoform 2-T2 [Spinachia spinachia]